MAKTKPAEIVIPLYFAPGKASMVLYGDSGGYVRFEIADDGVAGGLKLGALFRGKRIIGRFTVEEGNDKPQPKENIAKRKGRGPLKWA